VSGPSRGGRAQSSRLRLIEVQMPEPAPPRAIPLPSTADHILVVEPAQRSRDRRHAGPAVRRAATGSGLAGEGFAKSTLQPLTTAGARILRLTGWRVRIP